MTVLRAVLGADDSRCRNSVRHSPVGPVGRRSPRTSTSFPNHTTVDRDGPSQEDPPTTPTVVVKQSINDAFAFGIPSIREPVS